MATLPHVVPTICLMSSSHLFCGLLLFLFLGYHCMIILLHLSFPLIMWPAHFHFCLLILVMSWTLVLFLMLLFLTFPFFYPCDTPFYGMLVYGEFVKFFVKAQLSLPYVNTGRMRVLNSLPFGEMCKFLSFIISFRPQYFFQPFTTLLSTSLLSLSSEDIT